MEAFLLEVLVVGENSGQTLAAHGLHGNAVGEAVALVGTAGIKIEPGQKLPRERRSSKRSATSTCRSSGFVNAIQ